MGRSTMLLTVTMVAASLVGVAPMDAAQAADPAWVVVDQGPEWTPANRNKFYSLDQGSQLMPLSWIRALRQPDGTPFMADGLRRYGFLPNDAGPDMLPVGFTAAGQPGKDMIGMNCAACHTRQLEYAGVAYRIDGGPAFIDFQSLMSDLDKAAGTVLSDANAFAQFAGAVLGSTRKRGDETALRRALDDWHYRHHTLMHNALPPNPWGPGRLDAIGLIIDRLTGLDIGPQPPYVLPQNIKLADIPVRYPFLWNAARQDKTQWLGFAGNFNVQLALARNLGQVFGVFADFHPVKGSAPDRINYGTHNSASLPGLGELETLMISIGPPRWPWTIDRALADEGRKVFGQRCIGCHGAQASDLNPNFWKTPITPIDELKTDRRQLRWLDVTSETGILEGTEVPAAPERMINKSERSLDIVTFSVTGTMRDELPPPDPNPSPGPTSNAAPTSKPSPVIGYEARVLHGIWAAAPYLHNGSVPTLAELLKPAAQRVPSFKVGSSYDPVAVGLATEQPQSTFILSTTDCDDPHSGNSRCGHEFGTDLTSAEKQALLEFLKEL